MRAFGKNAYADYHAAGMSEFPLPARAFYSFAVFMVNLYTRILWPTSFEGAEGLVAHVRGVSGDKGGDGRGKGSVLVMNHVSMIEPVVLICMLWRRHHIHVRPIYKSEFDRNGFMRWALSRVGGIPVERDKADLKAVRNAQHALDRGECVLIFPEGTRVKSDDESVTIHGGFALMAQLAKASVVPLAVVGARDCCPRGARLSKPARVFIGVGDAITFDELGVEGRKQQLTAMEQVAMERVYALREELRAEHPGKM